MDNARYSQDNRTTDTQPGKAVGDAALMLPAWPEMDGPSGAIINLDDLATIVWAALTPARLITGETLDRPANQLIVWRKPHEVRRRMRPAGLRPWPLRPQTPDRRTGLHRQPLRLPGLFMEAISRGRRAVRHDRPGRQLHGEAAGRSPGVHRGNRPYRPDDPREMTEGAEWPREWRGMHTFEIMREAFQKRGSKV